MNESVYKKSSGVTPNCSVAPCRINRHRPGHAPFEIFVSLSRRSRDRRRRSHLGEDRRRRRVTAAAPAAAAAGLRCCCCVDDVDRKREQHQRRRYSRHEHRGANSPPPRRSRHEESHHGRNLAPWEKRERERESAQLEKGRSRQMNAQFFVFRSIAYNFYFPLLYHSPLFFSSSLLA